MDKSISLKAKMLLGQMLCLQGRDDAQTCSVAALMQFNREKVTAIRLGVRELEKAGYVLRSRERDEKGRLRGAVYRLCDQAKDAAPAVCSETAKNDPEGG